MALSFLKDLLSLLRYTVFKFLLSKKINHKIKNISGNISLMPFKLGTSNVHVHQVRYRVLPTVLLPWQQFGFPVYLMQDSLSQCLC